MFKVQGPTEETSDKRNASFFSIAYLTFEFLMRMLALSTTMEHFQITAHSHSCKTFCMTKLIEGSEHS